MICAFTAGNIVTTAWPGTPVHTPHPHGLYNKIPISHTTTLSLYPEPAQQFAVPQFHSLANLESFSFSRYKNHPSEQDRIGGPMPTNHTDTWENKLAELVTQGVVDPPPTENAVN